LVWPQLAAFAAAGRSWPQSRRCFIAFDRKPNREREPRINRRIRVPEVRLIGPDGEQLGLFITSEAIKRAEADGLDLVEVSPQARPPVCKIMDYGKYKYEQSKRKTEAKKKQQVDASVDR
jgi:translation initiation factor IF-3